MDNICLPNSNDVKRAKNLTLMSKQNKTLAMAKQRSDDYNDAKEEEQSGMEGQLGKASSMERPL